MEKLANAYGLNGHHMKFLLLLAKEILIKMVLMIVWLEAEQG